MAQSNEGIIISGGFLNAEQIAVGQGATISIANASKSLTTASEHNFNKVKILFLAANPLETARLKLDEEVKKIQACLKDSKEKDNLEFKQEWATTIDTLIQALLDEEPNIIHFSGHGEIEGIILQDAAGNSKLVNVKALSNLFQLFRNNVNCVVLNNCYSINQAASIVKHIPYVIGMNSTISDEVAISFATGFYKAIGAGKDISFAFELGKTATQLEGCLEENLFVLLTSQD